MTPLRRAYQLVPRLLLCAAFSVPAVTIKMGSIAPAGSPWDDALRQITAEWAAISGGTVVLKTYAGGIAGDEDDMLRKMRIGQLDAAGLSGMGLARVFTGILSVQLPLTVRTDDELNFVLDRMKPQFEKELEAKGFKVIMWNNVGWGHFYSKRPVVTPDDLRSHKLFNIAGDPEGTQAWKDAGFNAVPLSMTDLAAALQSGMVDAYTMTPLSTAAYQWFTMTPHMCGLKWAPLIGGVVISTRIWKQVKPELRDTLVAISTRIGLDLQKRIDKADAESIEVMKQRGVKVNEVSPAAELQWKAATEKAFAQMAGKSFDVQSYELVKKHLAEYRSAQSR
jgi:TRAP-type C4-dicarboxylate transport system substrate-binding protein